MSIAVQTAVWNNSKLNGTALLLLLAIADFANDAGEAWPSVATLAKKIRTSERNVNHLLVRLRRAKELEVRESKGPHGTNLYRVKSFSGVKGRSGVKAPSSPLKDSSSPPEEAFTSPLKPASPNPSIEPSGIISPIPESSQTLKVSRSNKERPASDQQHMGWQRAWAPVASEMRKGMDPEVWSKYFEGSQPDLMSVSKVVLAVPQAFLDNHGDDAAGWMARKIERIRPRWLDGRSLELVPLNGGELR